MTAIALLNAELEPHLVADTLLTADGVDQRPDSRTWLPALGMVPTNYQFGEKAMHLSRLARKTFILPCGSGVLAFAGDVSDAVCFWKALSERVLGSVAYGGSARVEPHHLETLRVNFPDVFRELSLLGVLVDPLGKLTPFVHNARLVETQNFGACYVAGSGDQLLEEIIRSVDLHLSANWWPVGYPMTATEDLAEHISTEMLYRESDFRNGLADDTPLALRCGGLFEWYRITKAGVSHMQPRLDLHVQRIDERLVITRAYWIEMRKRRELLDGALPAQMYQLHIMLLGAQFESVSAARSPGEARAVRFRHGHGALMEPAWHHYSQAEGDLSEAPGLGREYHAPLSKSVLEACLPHRVDVGRVRVVFEERGRRPIVKRILTRQREKFRVGISPTTGGVKLWLSGTVLDHLQGI